MQWSWLIIAVVVVGYALWMRRGAKGIQQMNAAALQGRLKDDARTIEVVDVREPFEFSGGHIARAKNIPLGKIDERMAQLPKDKDVVFVCRSGNRSMAAARKARQAGITSVYNLSGGMSRWTGTVSK